MARHIYAILALITLAVPYAWAQQLPNAEAESDLLLRAMQDELSRSKADLVIEGLERPYFIQYALTDASGSQVSARLGAIISEETIRSRNIETLVRVGSYELDNANFAGGYFGGRQASLPIEDDYDAIRQAIWWATDRDYKAAAETLVRKEAFMESKTITDKPNDFSKETPVIHLEDRIAVRIDDTWLSDTAKRLSAVFRDYPDVRESVVAVQVLGGNKYLLNTEGTRIRQSRMRFTITASVAVQAEDGMLLADSLAYHARRLEELPSINSIAEDCNSLAKELIEAKNAPLLESYTGPVLFDASAATGIFANVFAARFSGGQRGVGSRTSPDDFAKRLGTRVLPRFINVSDNPTLAKIDGKEPMGHYLFDEQGVPSRPVQLVEKGRLKALLMSRNPSKEFSSSTGHGRTLSAPSGSLGSMMVESTDGLTAEELKQELIEACVDEGLDYGIRIGSIGRVAGSLNPLAVFKVYRDGREERIRGVEFSQLDIKVFKRTLAAGSDDYVLNTARGQTVVAPAMLFEEVDLVKIDRDFDKQPILSSPLVRSTQVDEGKQIEAE